LKRDEHEGVKYQSGRERGRFPFNTAGLIGAGTFVTLVLFIGVMLGTYSSLLDRDQERQHAGTSSAEYTDIESKCFHPPVTTQAIDCVRKEVEAQRTAQHDQADLRAQQDVAALNIGILWFAGFSFISSGVGVVLLIWTFREQRNLTKGESRAYLEIGWAELGGDRTYGLTYGVWLTNSGKTPARNVRVHGTMRIVEVPRLKGGAGEWTWMIDETAPDKIHTGTFEIFVDHLAASRTDFFRSAPMPELLDIPTGLNQSHGSHYRTTGYPAEEEGTSPRHDRLTVDAMLEYEDVFGDEVTVRIEQYTYSLSDDEHLRGTGFAAPNPYAD
jgi:hypothetical protein